MSIWALRLAQLLTAITFAAAVSAQTSPFAISVQQSGTTTTVANGDTINVTAPDIAVPLPIVFTIVYRGETSVLLQSAGLFGSSQFAISQNPGSVRLNPGDSMTVTVAFRPVSSTLSSARLTIGYLEQTQGQTTPVSAALSFNLTGTAPELVLSYISPDTGNAVPVPDGGAISLPDTLVNGTSNTIASISNRGSAPTVLSGISLAGAPGIILTGLPLFPVTLAPGQQVPFGLRFSPASAGPVSSVLTVQAGQRTLLANVTGTSLFSAFTYEVLDGATSRLAKPGETLAFGDVGVGGEKVLVVTAINAGSTDGTISGIAISGAGFDLPDAPSFPQVVRANARVSFLVRFSPTVAGDARGVLRVGTDSFPLSGRALGPRLTYSYTLGANTFPLQLGGSIIFPPIAVGQRSSVTVLVQNVGTARALLSSIALADPRARFSLAGLPAFVASIKTGESLSFNIAYEPVTVGNSTVSLLVDTASFTLVASSTEPPPLPSYTIRIPGDAVPGPLEQGALSLALAEPYSLSVNGVLNLTTATDPLPADPGAVFSNGARALGFTIPAGTREAVFAGSAAVARFQTGTVSGRLMFTPTFATTAGGVDLTPASPAGFVVEVPPAAPWIVSLQVTGVSASGLTLAISGYATTRSLTSMSVRFETLPNIQVSTRQFDIPVDAIMRPYFASASGQASGSQFLISLPFSFGTVGGVALPARLFSSAEVTLVNSTGASSAVRVEIPSGT